MIKNILKYCLIIFTILLCNVNIFSQNLVINPSFELYNRESTSIPGCDTSIYIKNWHVHILGSPDYFNSFNNNCFSSYGVPSNLFGYANPKEGNAYFGMGLGGISNSFTNPYGTFFYEYIEGILLYPLKQGKKYCVSFYARFSDSSMFSTWSLGAYLSKDSIPPQDNWDTINNYYFHFTPQIQNPDGNFLNKKEWVKIEGNFIADGDEKYIIIGNFNKRENSLYKYSNFTQNNSFCYAYYYIDMVSVTLCEDTIKPKPEQKNIAYIPNVFSPNGDGVNDTFCVRGENIMTMNLQVFNRWGEMVFESHEKANCWDGTYKGALASIGVYFYTCNVIFINGEVRQLQGSVTIVR